MNKKYFIFVGLIFMFLLTYNIIALTTPSIIYPTSAGIRINNGTEINWTFSTDLDIVKYNLFYSNDSGANWFSIIYNWGHINHLNDSNTLKNLSFIGNQNITEYFSIPKIANITIAKLNFTGYLNVTGPYTRAYNSFTSESESDGSGSVSSSCIGFGRCAAYHPVDLYFLIFSPPNGTFSILELKLGPLGNYNASINYIYNISIAETSDYLIGIPENDNTTTYSVFKQNFNTSVWGNSQNVFVNITSDISYPLNSSKKYILWFKFISGGNNSNMIYSVDLDANPTNNFTATKSNIYNTSLKYISNFRIYTPTEQKSSNLWMEVGNIDGIHEWNFTGNFTITNMTNDFSSPLQAYIQNNCTANLWENCSIPITINSNSTGKVEISTINIQFTDYWWNTTSFPELTTYKINITAINSTTNGSSDISVNDFIISHNSPNTTLNIPAESYSNSTSSPVNVIFNCSATDDYSLSNINLYITNNQNTNFSLNQTTNISGNTNTTTWTLSLSNGNYTWNCLAYDSVGNSGWDINRSIKINYTAPAATESPFSGGGGRGRVYFECTKNSDCKEEYYCYNYKCVKLFDVRIIKIDSPLKKEQFFNLTYSVKSIGKINNDVLIEFWLEKNNKKITSGHDTIYFGESEEKINEVNLFLPGNIETGTYDCYVRANYGDYNASAKRTVQVGSFIEEEIVKTELPSEKPPFLYELWNKIKSISKIFWRDIVNNKTYLVLFGVLIIILVLFFLLIKLLLEKIISKNERFKNRIKNLIKKKVYTEEGNYIGYIEEVIFWRNHIDSLRIKLNKKIKARKRIKKMGVIVKYKDIKNINEIVIADKGIEDFLDGMNK